jgi:predicted O-methyltransferase YrrM
MLDVITGIALAGIPSRLEMWKQIIDRASARQVLEIGVWKGEFAAHILTECPSVIRYFMIDPWRQLDAWNKPFNVDRSTFDAVYAEALSRTDFASDRREILRGRTVDVIDAIPDGTLDVAYIDGDHTLRGIAIDMIRAYPKVRPGGILGGDDFTASIWQHSEDFEPTLIFPFVTYFAEAMGAPLVILPHNQFAIIKPIQSGNAFSISGLTEGYEDASLLAQVRKRT